MKLKVQNIFKKHKIKFLNNISERKINKKQHEQQQKFKDKLKNKMKKFNRKK